ncbi:MAG: hypothetical protein PVG07_03415 [Acidobacteriota bacterium]|jgi:hypothetical protein
MTYQPFLLLSHLRSGTHFLRTSLESHPRVVCQTELFNSNARTLPYPFTTPTAEILERHGFPERPDGVRASGFVLHSYHPGTLRAFPHIRPNPRWEDVWDLLAAMDGLRVVRLVRRNLLRRHLSQLLADRTRQWHDWRSDRMEGVSHLGVRPPAEQVDAPRPPPEPIEIDLDRMVLDFEEVEELRRRAARRLGHHPTLEVAYEDLCRDLPGRVAGILEHLGVDPGEHRPEPAVNRLERRPLVDAVSNHDALRDRLAGTRWADFLDS